MWAVYAFLVFLADIEACVFGMIFDKCDPSTAANLSRQRLRPTCRIKNYNYINRIATICAYKWNSVNTYTIYTVNICRFRIKSLSSPSSSIIHLLPPHFLPRIPSALSSRLVAVRASLAPDISGLCLRFRQVCFTGMEQNGQSWTRTRVTLGSATDCVSVPEVLREGYSDVTYSKRRQIAPRSGPMEPTFSK